MKKFLIGIIILLCLVACGSKDNENDSLKEHSNESHVASFIEKLNQQDSSIDVLLAPNAIYTIIDIGQADLGKASDSSSFLSYLMEVQTAYTACTYEEGDEANMLKAICSFNNYTFDTIYNSAINAPDTLVFTFDQNNKIEEIYEYYNEEKWMEDARHSAYDSGLIIQGDSEEFYVVEVDERQTQVQIGDIVLAINDLPCKDMKRFEPNLRMLSVDDDNTKLTLLRNNQEIIVEIPNYLVKP